MNCKTALLAQFHAMVILLFIGLCPAHSSSLERILLSGGLDKSDLGILIEDEERITFSLNSQHPMIPASLTKIITAAAAFELLKPQYQFKTKLFTDGLREGNTMKGSLYLKGGGDPSITVEKLPELVQVVQNQNISRIEG